MMCEKVIAGPSVLVKNERWRLDATLLAGILLAAGLSGCLYDDDEDPFTGDGNSWCDLEGFELSFFKYQASLNLSRFNFSEENLENYSVSLRVYSSNELVLENVTFAYDEDTSNHTMAPMWSSWTRDFDVSDSQELRFVFNITHANDTFMLFNFTDTLWIMFEHDDILLDPPNRDHPTISRSEDGDDILIDGFKIGLVLHMSCGDTP